MSSITVMLKLKKSSINTQKKFVTRTIHHGTFQPVTSENIEDFMVASI